LTMDIIKCQICHTATYCSEECQVANGVAHRKICKSPEKIINAVITMDILLNELKENRHPQLIKRFLESKQKTKSAIKDGMIVIFITKEFKRGYVPQEENWVYMSLEDLLRGLEIDVVSKTKVDPNMLKLVTSNPDSLYVFLLGYIELSKEVKVTLTRWCQVA
jgi:hypothetical protein